MINARALSAKAVWPCPVYVAELATGEIVRMSFYSEQGKPLDVARGRRVCQGLNLAEMGDRLDSPRTFRPLRRGHVEWNGQQLVDQHAHLTPDQLAPAGKAKPKPHRAARLLADLVASMPVPNAPQQHAAYVAAVAYLRAA